MVAFCDQQKTVAGCEFWEGFEDAGKEVDGVLLDLHGEGTDVGVMGFDGEDVCELAEAVGKRHAEAGEAIATGGDCGLFTGVERGADVLGRVLGGVLEEPCGELGDGALEVDIVLPERVVSVNEEGLGDHGLSP